MCVYIYLHSRIFLHRGSKRLFWPEFLLPQDLVTQLPEVATEAGNFRALGFLWNLYGILKDILGFGFYVFFFWFCVIFWDILGFLWNMFGFLLSILETLFSTFFGVTMSPKQMQKHFKLSRKHSRVLLFDLFGAYSLRQTKIQNISRYWDLKNRVPQCRGGSIHWLRNPQCRNDVGGQAPN